MESRLFRKAAAVRVRPQRRSLGITEGCESREPSRNGVRGQGCLRQDHESAVPEAARWPHLDWVEISSGATWTGRWPSPGGGGGGGGARHLAVQQARLFGQPAGQPAPARAFINNADRLSGSRAGRALCMAPIRYCRNSREIR